MASKSKKSLTGSEATIWEKELEINRLIEESSIHLTEGDLGRSLELAKEAGKKERSYLSYLQSNSLLHDGALQMTFATWFHLALVYEKNEMYQEAIQAYTYLVKQKKFQKNIGVVRVQLGNIYYIQRSYDDAIQMYRMAADTFGPENKEKCRTISAKMGHAYARQGKFVTAIHHYENASRSSQDLSSIFNLLICHAILGNTQEVKKIFVKMLNSAVKGFVQSTYQRYHKSSSDIDTIIVKDPLEEYLDQKMQKLTTLIFTAAHIVLLSINNLSTTDDTFAWMQNQLKEHFPQIAVKVELNHAIFCLYSQDYDRGLRLLKSFEKKDQESLAMAAVNLSTIFFLEKNYYKSNFYADMALKQSRFNVNALVNKGNLILEQGDLETARDFYLEALSVNSACPEAIYNLGLVYTRLKQDEDALVTFEKLHHVSPNDPPVIYQVASIYERQIQWTMAMKWYNLLYTRIPVDGTMMMKLDQLAERMADEK